MKNVYPYYFQVFKEWRVGDYEREENGGETERAVFPSSGNYRSRQRSR